jgi:hypothetical protein
MTKERTLIERLRTADGEVTPYRAVKLMAAAADEIERLEQQLTGTRILKNAAVTHAENAWKEIERLQRALGLAMGMPWDEALEKLQSDLEPSPNHSAAPETPPAGSDPPA